ncbi:MAG: hypothetical protein AAF705_06255, partial [Bacteroidota bacterium]
MTKAIVETQSQKTQKDEHYISLKALLEHLMEVEADIPYKSVFSFKPFIEKIKANISGGQTKESDPFLQEIERLVSNFTHMGHNIPLEKRHEIVATLFPSLFFEGQMGFVAMPFNKEFFFLTPAFQEVFDSEEWQINIADKLPTAKMGSPAIEAGKLILKSLYNQEFESKANETMTFRHRDTKLERHMKVDIVFDYINTTSNAPLPELDEQKIHQLYNEWDNEAFWLEQFPPENFEFEGLVIGYVQDVTEVAILSKMKEMMLTGHEREMEDAPDILDHLNQMVRSFLQMPDIAFGNLLKRGFKYADLVSWSILGGLDIVSQFTKEDFVQSKTYGKIIAGQQLLIVGSLENIEEPGKIERHLLSQGYQSLLLVPQKDRGGRTIGVVELASTQAYCFNRQIATKLEELITLFTMGGNRWIQEVDNSINFFIQEQFTYIHPSVQWKFQEVSQKFLLSAPESDQISTLEPIVFKNVYPLYGQSDIVSSSKIRNRSIEADMLDNLQRVVKVIKAFRKRLEFQLLDVYQARAEALIQRLEDGGYVSSDESQIVELLVQDIHPLLRELSGQFEDLPKGILKKYFNYLDPNLDLVYRQRKDYEDSVLLLNTQIANFIDQEVTKKQKVLPHFFEKYVTDGVEYNIYVGQSLLQDGQFSEYFLKDFRLWQLILMCNVTRLVEKARMKLPVQLSTAQLIFVYNNALSI